ncbi:MAG: ABC transporter ATP-binding protein [Eubacteriales bacterium]|nr:ABC transporter ATP-binding protein [Eubacteriales bacterium]
MSEMNRRTPNKPPMRRGPGGGMMPGDKPKHFKKTLLRLLAYLKPQMWGLIAVFVMSVAATLFSVLSPRIMGSATSYLFEGMVGAVKGTAQGFSLEPIVKILVQLGVLYLASAVLSYGQQYIMAGVTQRTTQRMRGDINQKLNRLPLKFFDGTTHGEVLSRMTNDVDTISGTLQQSLTQIISSIITLVGVLVMMLVISPLMTLIALLMLPVSLLLTMRIAKRSQKHFAGQQGSLGELNGHVEEMYAGHIIIKAFGREKNTMQNFDEINQRLYTHGWKAQFISGIMMPVLGFVGNLSYVAVCVVGAMKATGLLGAPISIGDIQAFIQYVRQFNQPITQTANIANVIQSAIAAGERVFELLDEPEEVPDAAKPVPMPTAKGEVEFGNVSFGYTDELLMKDISIHVQPGQQIAIVGTTGAGKTTLVNLIMRFYEINGGAIRIDGVDIRDMSRVDLRNLLGMVLQDTWLFSGSIYENIAYGKDGATREEVMAAAKAAHADHFIRTLPQGYDTVLNEDATNISQGQRQLLTIAQAILADPEIMILDEATSSVDTRTEVLIQKAMQSLMKGRTSFIIAHRLSTIRGADNILVMEKGNIIEMGTHEQLMAAKGYYWDLYNSQFTAKEAG